MPAGAMSVLFFSLKNAFAKPYPALTNALFLTFCFAACADRQMLCRADGGTQYLPLRSAAYSLRRGRSARCRAGPGTCGTALSGYGAAGMSYALRRHAGEAPAAADAAPLPQLSLQHLRAVPGLRRAKDPAAHPGQRRLAQLRKPQLVCT